MRRISILTISMTATFLASIASAAETPPAIGESLKAITAVSREGAGNDAAAKAWKSLVAAGAPALLPTLSAIDSEKPAAANWLRTLVDALAEAEKKAARPLPIADMMAFATDTKRDPAARRIAYELIASVDQNKANELLPKFINDPSIELRRDAIQKAFQTEMSINRMPDPEILTKLFDAARDKDQVETIAKALVAREKTPNITKHYGFITEWQLVGPFPSPKDGGFTKAQSPEASVDLGAKYEGSAGPITWKYAQSDATYGSMDLNAELGKHKDAAAYAYAVIDATADTPAEIRATTKNAIRIFVNGKLVFEREEYHHGMKMDQHAARIQLNKGKNEILLKVCQNNQTDSWAQDWTLAARICDATGGLLPVKQIVRKNGEDRTVELGELKAMKKDSK